MVAALCDRRRGLGADGVLRVTTAGALLAAGALDRRAGGVTADDWYMDYRNADGSTAQMCGNGARVFAHYLRASGVESRNEFVVGSLAGPRPVVLHHVDATNADVSVDMGKVNTLGEGRAVVGGRTFSGLAVDVGNPHLACVDPKLTVEALAALDVAAPVDVRQGTVPGWGQRRGSHRPGRRRGQHASARAWCWRNPLLRHRNRRRRRCRAVARRNGQRRSHRAGSGR